jgi:hypothetical protein
MKRARLCFLVAAVCIPGGGASVNGQGPDGPGFPPGVVMRGPAGGGRTAEFLLGHVGELQLTDAQVVRLAAIARRAEARRRSLQATMDSMRTRITPRPDSMRRERRPVPPEFEAARRNMEQMREQEHADLRDAITVLTPDQQAMAWEMVSAGGSRRPRSGIMGGPGGPRTGIWMERPGGPGGRTGPGRPTRPAPRRPPGEI